MKKLGFCGAFFLFLVFYALYIPLPSEKHPICFYSNHSRDDLKQTTLKALRQAQHSVWIHTYALTDASVLSLLKQKAEQGIDIHIFYHQKNTPKLHLFEQKHLHFHPIKDKGLMHEKWMVIDETQVFLGTANLTLSSLSMHDNFLLGLYSPALGAALQNGSHRHTQTTIQEQQLELFLLPQKEGLDHLLSQLDKAQKTVTLALFTFTHPLLVKKLLELHERGVHIELFLDAYTARGASKKALKQLQEAGIEASLSQGLPLFHHKWALIDSKTFILGSANWTRAAFEKNKDYILFLSNITKEQFKHINKIINIIKNDTSIVIN